MLATGIIISMTAPKLLDSAFWLYGGGGGESLNKLIYFSEQIQDELARPKKIMLTFGKLNEMHGRFSKLPIVHDCWKNICIEYFVYSW